MTNNISACSLLESRRETSFETTDVVHITVKQQEELLQTKLLQCLCDIQREPHTLTGLYCDRIWDNLMCWDDTLAGTTSQQPCPSYINNFKTHQFASRTCLPNGTWYVHPTLDGVESSGWTNFSACLSNNTIPDREGANVPYLIIKHLNEFRIMYNVGYGLSLVSLVFAFFIMIFFRKLHCSRNTIHINLFTSFILRAAISLIRDNFMVAGLGFPKDVSFNDSGGVMSFKDGPHWECRLFFSLFQYVIAASYIWIFVEAVYIHMLIFVAVFTEKIKVFWYMIIGWSFPLVIVITWCVSRLILDNSLCWNTHTNYKGLQWLLQGPIMLTVVINFIFFINLVRVLYTKLSESPCPEVKKYKYRKLTRSTLFLIPVFGVYYILFTLPIHNLSDTVEFVMLFIEMFFNSYQGFFIALVLCFLNTEVKTEIRKAWRRRDFRRGSGHAALNTAAFRSQHVNSTSMHANGIRIHITAEKHELTCTANGKAHTAPECEETPFLTEVSEVQHYKSDNDINHEIMNHNDPSSGVVGSDTHKDMKQDIQSLDNYEKTERDSPKHGREKSKLDCSCIGDNKCNNPVIHGPIECAIELTEHVT